MADKTISQLTSASTLSGAALFEIEQGNGSYKVSLDKIRRPTTQRLTDTGEPTGIIDRTQSVITFSDATSAFSISGVGGQSYGFYSQGNKVTKDGSVESVQIDGTEGLYFFYFDHPNGLLSTTKDFDVYLILEKTILGIVYWDATNKKSIYFGEERHGITMDGKTHLYLHQTRGAVYESGLGLTNINTDGSGDVVADVSVGVATGKIWDEDINLTLSALPCGSNWPVYYREGTGNWRLDDDRPFPVKNATTGNLRLAYNLNSGGNWSQNEIINNDFVLAHIFGTNDPNRPIIAIQGQNEYSTIGNARTAAATELRTLLTENLPFAEFVPIGTVIYQTSSGYTNIPKARIISTDDGSDYEDFRGITGSPVGGQQVNEHSNLSGLDDDDHIQYLLGFTGNETLASGSPSASVTFASAESDTDYRVHVSLLNTVDVNPTVYSHIITSKTTSGFTVRFSSSIDSNNYSMDWTISRRIE